MARADAKMNTAALSPITRRYKNLWLTGLLVMTGLCFYPPPPAQAQQKMGTPANEKASKHIGGLPDIFGKKSENAGKPVLQRHQVYQKPASEAQDKKEAEPIKAQKTDTGQEEDKTGKEHKEAAAPEQTPSSPEKQSPVYRHLGKMGVNAKGMKNAVFLQSSPNATEKKDSE